MNKISVLLILVGAIGISVYLGLSFVNIPIADNSSSWKPVPIGYAQGEYGLQMQKATSARDALGSRLMSQLTGAIESDGPQGAVGICSTIAPQLATQIGNEFDVSIGRTSHKLRNQSNVAPDWMQDVVDGLVEEPSVFAKADGSIAAAYPIRIAAACLLCHGDPDTILQDVQDQLIMHYPEDQATGFGLGDLRGWFWIEVAGE